MCLTVYMVYDIQIMYSTIIMIIIAISWNIIIMLSHTDIRNYVYVIDKLHTTDSAEVIRYTRGGYAIDTEAKPSPCFNVQETH